ncbi:outer membrane lipoprotein carrier protein LolA [Flavobacteriaceae bacterium F08102]|nr:outer membrane lipoprotein carrier protein LolA [Flavobacteriaceae bacterium F08102]
MMKYTILFLIFTVSAGSIRAQRSMDASEIQLFKQAVQQKAANTTSILSDFTQYKHLDFLENDIVSAGVLAFKAPETVKWGYQSPFTYSVLFENGKLFIDDEGKKSDVKVGGSPLFKELSELIVKSVRGDMFDANKFTIRYFKTKQGYEVELDTKDPDFKKYIAQFVLTFNTAYSVHEVKMMEPSGDFTRIVFTNRKDNIPIDEKIFMH